MITSIYETFVIRIKKKILIETIVLCCQVSPCNNYITFNVHRSREENGKWNFRISIWMYKITLVTVTNGYDFSLLSSNALLYI
jgi:hypothetical protein